jgi:HTH-type transcriptional regulator, glycine betaine synthesis regulator
VLGLADSLIQRNGRAADTVTFEIAVVSFFIDAAEMLGVPKSVAAIYGICFASPEPLSFADIQERLAISQGSISQGLKVLREVGALRVTGHIPIVNQTSVVTDAKRRDYYEPDLELRNLIGRYLEQRLERQLAAGHDRLQLMVKAVPNLDSRARTLQGRIEALQTWHEKSRAILPLAKTFLKLT